MTFDASVRWSLASLPRDEVTLPIAAESVALSPDASRLALVSDDKPIAVWDVQNNSLLCELEQQHFDRFASPVFSSDNQRILAFEPCSSDSRTYQACVYDAISGKLLRRFDKKINRRISSVDIHPDGNFIAAVVAVGDNEPSAGASTAWQLKVWEVSPGEAVMAVPLDSEYSTVKYIRGGSEIGLLQVVRSATQGGSFNFDYNMLVHDARSLAYLRTIRCTPATVIRTDPAKQSPGEYQQNGDPTVRSMLTGEVELQLPVGQRGRLPGGYARTQDGSRIATLSSLAFDSNHISRPPDNELAIWNVETGDKLFSATLPGYVPFTRMAFNSDDSQLVIAWPGNQGASLMILDARR